MTVKRTLRDSPSGSAISSAMTRAPLGGGVAGVSSVMNRERQGTLASDAPDSPTQMCASDVLVLIAHSTIGQEHIQMRLHEPGRLAALVVDLQPNRGGGIGRSTCRISSLPISSLLERWHSETATSHLSNREAFGFQGLAADDALRCQPRRGCVRRYSWLRREVIVYDVDGVRGLQQRNEARCWRLAAYMTPEVHLT